jgi:hypothetical protein
MLPDGLFPLVSPLRLESQSNMAKAIPPGLEAIRQEEPFVYRRHLSRLSWETKRAFRQGLAAIERTHPMEKDSFVSRARFDLDRCGSRPIALINFTSPQNVEFSMSDTTGAVGIGGLAYCNRMTCPLCADRIARLRSASAIDGLHSRIDKVKNSVAVAVTLTVSHTANDSFETVFKALEKKFEKLISKYRALEKRARYKVSIDTSLCGYLASFETTIGRNGHHAHWHIILFLPVLILANELKDYVKSDLCDNKMGREGVERAAEIIESHDTPRLISYIEKGMFEVTGVGKTNHKNGNKGLFEGNSDSHFKMYAEVHCGAKGKRLFRSGGDLRKIRKEFEEAQDSEPKDIKDSKELVAVVVTDEFFDTSSLPQSCITLHCKGRKLARFCEHGVLQECISVLLKSNSVRDAREGIGKLFDEFSS